MAEGRFERLSTAARCRASRSRMMAPRFTPVAEGRPAPRDLERRPVRETLLDAGTVSYVDRHGALGMRTDSYWLRARRVSRIRERPSPPKLTLAGMRGPLQCAAPSALDQCKDDWTALRALVGAGAPSDASVVTPLASTPSAQPAARPGGCRCSLPMGAPPARGAMAAGFLAALVWACRRYPSFRRNRR